MATLTIEGRRVQIDDGFRALPRDQQDAIVQDIARQIGLAPRTQEASPEREVSPATRAQSPRVQSGADAAILGALDTATFGFLDEAGAAIDRGIDYVSGREGRTYAQHLEGNQNEAEGAQEQYPNSYLAGQVAGGVGSGAGLARAGLSLGANAARAGAGLGRTAMASAADGLALGALAGSGSGEGMEGRVQGAISGGALGLAGGAVAPYAIAGAGAALRPVLAPVTARLRPDNAAASAITTAARRSGLSADEIAARLHMAQDDGQGMFTAADALGHSGERLLSTVTRTPNEARQGVVEALQARQAGQGERLSNILAEGFDAPDTAAQRVAGLSAAREVDAGINYGAARGGARPVDPSRAIKTADVFLRPGATGSLSPQSNIADDSVEAAVRRARSYLTDGRSMLTDYNAAFRAKLELDNMIDGAKPVVQRHLRPIRDRLDEALAASSDDYANARDTYARQSRTIRAVEQGGEAASGRGRATDNIQGFNGLSPDERQAFRAGYVDPLIRNVERAPGPLTNKARPLITDKTRQEFPAFAAPGQGDQLGRRIGREQRMFETANAALGGSKTADNLADQADLGRFDPSIVASFLQGRPVSAAIQAVSSLVAEARGMPPSVLQRVARVLMETRPDVVRKILSDGMSAQRTNDGRRALANSILTALNGAAAGRLSAP